MSDFPKQYDPKLCESKMQQLWEDTKSFEPKESRTGNTFYIPIPPPNVTGNLHIGHALTLTLEDIMVRYHRMKWDSTLWVPGTDHAGIATQAKVEEGLLKKGIKRKELGREKFLEEMWKWLKEYRGNISNQFKRMGASVDWSKERFTLDDGLHNCVEDAFIDMYNKWLIYRWEYMVNYSPALESVISDIEVDYEEVEEKMYYINYFVSGSDKELLVATTRPETLLGDQAVAVHPKDKRYKKLIGRSVILPILNKEIPIIGDEMVDMEFWTGVVKITPAHDPADFETAKRHKLRTDYSVIERNGKMSKEAGIFEWLDSSTTARENIVELLRAKGNLVKIEPYTHKVGFCSRGKCRIETVISTQWFVRAWEMAKKVITGYEKNEFEIIPERFEKTFEDWIYNLRDWCISRQLWWWHQIPAYFHKETWELLGVTRNPEELYNQYWKENVRRDDDVLDTWFSSALWPFSILDWNNTDPGELFKKYYPANVLETGHDILFFWVIRMLIMGYEFTGETPFKTIYLHGLVFDDTGRKMSKSWGNVIDPLDVIEKNSTDALRLACVIGNTPGNNLNFSMRSVEENGLFLNKLWNIVRFAWMNVWDITEERSAIEARILKNKDKLLPYEKWILSRLALTIGKMTEWMEEYSFSASGTDLISFIRDDFADAAIEAYKIEKDRSLFGKDVIQLCILDIITMLHPYTPHITEMLYGQITGWKLLITTPWPITELLQEKSSEDMMSRIFEIVRTIRNIRAESGIKPGELRDVFLVVPKIYLWEMEDNASLITGLARINQLSIGNKPIRSAWYAYWVTRECEVYVDAHIDESKREEEISRLSEQLNTKKEYLRALNTKLKNNAFIMNAPEKVVRAEMEKKKLVENEIIKLEEKLKSTDIN